VDSGIIACFIAYGLPILMQPAHPQYRPINRFLLSRPYLDLNEPPLFFSHFHGTGSKRPREDRLWLLAVLRSGLHSHIDFAMCSHGHVFQLLLSCHDSPFADVSTRDACLSVLLRATSLDQAASEMLGSLGILAWICDRIASCHLAEVDGQMAFLLCLVRSDIVDALSGWQLQQSSLAAVSLWTAVGASFQLRTHVGILDTAITDAVGISPDGDSRTVPINVGALPRLQSLVDLALIHCVAWSTFPSAMLLEVLIGAHQLDQFDATKQVDAANTAMRTTSFIRALSTWDLHVRLLLADGAEIVHLAALVDSMTMLLLVHAAEGRAVAFSKITTEWADWLQRTLALSVIFCSTIVRRPFACRRLILLHQWTHLVAGPKAAHDTTDSSRLDGFRCTTTLNRALLLLTIIQHDHGRWPQGRTSCAFHRVAKLLQLAHTTEATIATRAERALSILMMQFWGGGHGAVGNREIKPVNETASDHEHEHAVVGWSAHKGAGRRGGGTRKC